MPNYNKLALEGGGVKGVSYLGVAEALDKLELLKEIEAVSGSSAGAISALFIASGWSVDKMKQRFKKLDFEKLTTGGLWGTLKSWWRLGTQRITGKKHFGLYDGVGFYQLFKEIIKEVTGSEKTTFEQWHKLKAERPELGLKDISVQACNINRGLNETFSHDTMHKDVPIAHAIRASMGFPGVFTAWTIKGCLYSDGGLQKNCPSDVFEAKPGKYNPEVLSVKLDSFDQIKYFDKEILPPPKEIKTALECAIAQFECSLNAQDYMFQQSPYKQATIFCDTLDVGTLDFNLSEDKKEALEASGEYGVIRYFYQIKPKKVEKYYDKETLKQLKAGDFPICFSEFIKKQAIPAELTAEPKSEEELSARRSARLKPATTPLYQHWCKNKALKADAAALTERLRSPVFSA